jgi:hypothetical protein
MRRADNPTGRPRRSARSVTRGRRSTFAFFVVAAALANPGIAQDNKSVAREVSFYARIEFSKILQADEIKAQLDQFTSRSAHGFLVRLISPPRLCAGPGSPWRERWVGLTGAALPARLEPLSAPQTGFFFALSFDFASLSEEAPGRIRIDWYHCPRGLSYSLHSDATGAHFMLKEDGEPMLAWSAR